MEDPSFLLNLGLRHFRAFALFLSGTGGDIRASKGLGQAISPKKKAHVTCAFAASDHEGRRGTREYPLVSDSSTIHYRCVRVMLCSDCASRLDETPVDTPCPRCGSVRRSNVVVVGTAVENESALPIGIVTQRHDEGGFGLVTVERVGFRSTSEIGPKHGLQTFAGRPPQNEDDVLQVCRALRTAMESDGRTCGRFRLPDSGAIDDVDAIADEADGQVTRVQVTRVQRAAWRELAARGLVEMHSPVAEMAADIRTAIESKLVYADVQRATLDLALDATRSPGHTHEATVRAFLADHEGWAAQLGFRAIWLVGAAATLTYRLC